MSRLIQTGGAVSLVVLALTARPALATPPMHIVAVTDHAHPFSGVRLLRDQGIKVKVLYLDAPQRLLIRLNQDLPRDPKTAAAVARKRLHMIDTRKVKRAYAALQSALKYRLQHYPAIIFNQRAIVLGVTDLPASLRRYRRWRDHKSSRSQR